MPTAMYMSLRTPIISVRDGGMAPGIAPGNRISGQMEHKAAVTKPPWRSNTASLGGRLKFVSPRCVEGGTLV